MERLNYNYVHSLLPKKAIDWVSGELAKCEIVFSPMTLWRGVGRGDEPFDGTIWANEHQELEGLHGSCWTINGDVAGHFGDAILVIDFDNPVEMLKITSELYDVWASMGGSGYGEATYWEKGEALGINDKNVSHIGDLVMTHCFENNIQLIQLYEFNYKARYAENEVFIPFSPFLGDNSEFPFDFVDIDE